jgi:hypothetical protein
MRIIYTCLGILIFIFSFILINDAIKNVSREVLVLPREEEV